MSLNGLVSGRRYEMQKKGTKERSKEREWGKRRKKNRREDERKEMVKEGGNKESGEGRKEE